jgi:hypothetical protein
LTLSTIGEDALLGAEVLYQFGLALYDTGDQSMAREVWRTARDAFDRLAAQDWLRRVTLVLDVGASAGYFGCQKN